MDEFNDDELEAVAYQMGLEGEQVWSSDDVHGARVLKLIKHTVRRGTLPALLSIVERERPRKA